MQELRTVYVEHDIDAEEADTCVVNFVVEDEGLKGLNASEEEVVKVLSSVGFTTEMLQQSVGSLSGGWKMKLALGRIPLLSILLLVIFLSACRVGNVFGCRVVGSCLV